MALGVVIVGFGLQAVRIGPHYVGMPLTVHLHGLTFLSWCLLAVVQPLLIGVSRWKLHRILGWVGGLLAAAMTLTGIALTNAAVARGLFAPLGGVFLMVNVSTMLAFATLVASAIVVRRSSDWHRRLLTCATIVLTGPAWSRILPTGWLGMWALLAIAGMALLFVAAGMVYDKRARGRIHPAWFWGGFGVASPAMIAPLLGFSPPVTEWVAHMMSA